MVSALVVLAGVCGWLAYAFWLERENGVGLTPMRALRGRLPLFAVVWLGWCGFQAIGDWMVHHDPMIVGRNALSSSAQLASLAIALSCVGPAISVEGLKLLPWSRAPWAKV